MIPTVELNDGQLIPQLGFGAHKVPQDDAARVVSQALDIGYRHIDTAQGYENERGVGHAIAASGLDRSELFVTTKLTNSQHGAALPRLALLESLEALGLDYVDLFLIHWPQPKVGLFVETWRALIQLRHEGLARSIGVSNFNPDHLEQIINDSGEIPTVNQVEEHPEFVRYDLDDIHDYYGIVQESWAPLGQNKGLLQLDTVRDLAAEYERTPAQIVLRWAVQRGRVALVKSSDRDRAAENFQIFDFELDGGDVDTLTALDAARRLGPDPVEFNGSNRNGR